MAAFSGRRIRSYLRAAEDGATTTERGRALEDLVCYVFGKVPGISITHRNRLNAFNSEEIDVALWNEKRPSAFGFLPHLVLVEAKNWSKPVGSSEVAWFDRKLRTRGLTFGVLVATNGITGDAEQLTSAHQIVTTALTEQRQLVVITKEELTALERTDDLVQLVKVKLCELAVTGSILF